MWSGRGVCGVDGVGDTAWNSERCSGRGATAPRCQWYVTLTGPGVTGLVKRQAGGTKGCKLFCGENAEEHGERIKD